MATIKQIFKWISSNLKIFLLVLSIVVLSILVFWWGRKNSQIRALANQLAVMTARLKLERLEVKYKLDMDELQKLKEKDNQIANDLIAIEQSLEKKLAPNMSADEIIAKFKELGIR